MKITRTSLWLSAIAAIATSGCGSAPPVPTLSQALEQGYRSRPGANAGAAVSWMAPEAKTDDLLYVGGNNAELTVYSYPKGKLVGAVQNPDFYVLSGECVDAAGDIFVTSLGNGKIFEYKHGGKKPIATLQAATIDPVDCSVDPTTGNLAVTTLGFGSSGNVAVYPHASGSPTNYTDPNIYYYFFCSYDDQGNLYVDGQEESPRPFRFAELPRGSGTFTDVTLNQTIDWPSSVLWDGKYVAVGDEVTPDVYEFAVSGSTGTLEASTPINGVQYDDAFWLRGSRILVATGGGSYQSIEFFGYPAGGNPIKAITKGVAGPGGLTISPAKK